MISRQDRGTTPNPLDVFPALPSIALEIMHRGELAQAWICIQVI